MTRTAITEREESNIVGAVLREARTDAGMSQHDVHRQTRGVFKASVLGAYERGERNVTVDRLYELAGIYRVSPGALLVRMQRRRDAAKVGA